LHVTILDLQAMLYVKIKDNISHWPHSAHLMLQEALVG